MMPLMGEEVVILKKEEDMMVKERELELACVDVLMEEVVVVVLS